MKYYLENVEDVLKELDTSINGLNNEQVDLKGTYHGLNKLDESKKEGVFKKIISSISDPMIIMLLVTAGILAFTSWLKNESFSDVFIILFVVIINTIMGIVQESKAEKAIDSLKEMTKATSKVIRNGKKQVIKSEEIVVGDILDFEAGDVVPADCRIIEEYSLKAEESALTRRICSNNKNYQCLKLKK